MLMTNFKNNVCACWNTNKKIKEKTLFFPVGFILTKEQPLFSRLILLIPSVTIS